MCSESQPQHLEGGGRRSSKEFKALLAEHGVWGQPGLRVCNSNSIISNNRKKEVEKEEEEEEEKEYLLFHSLWEDTLLESDG